MRLENKIAIVTGAAQGIGRGIAIEFAKEGADLMLMDLNGDRLAQTAKEIEALGQAKWAAASAYDACVNGSLDTKGVQVPFELVDASNVDDYLE